MKIPQLGEFTSIVPRFAVACNPVGVTGIIISACAVPCEAVVPRPAGNTVALIINVPREVVASIPPPSSVKLRIGVPC